jgi:hypothetical protein
VLAVVNTYTGTTAVSNGVLSLNVTTGTLAAASVISMNGGTFEVDNAGATAAESQVSGTLGVSTAGYSAAGDSTVRLVRTANQDITLTFSGLANPSRGFAGDSFGTAAGTVNFVTGGGVNGVTNGINLTGVAAGYINQGMFYGGGDYAFMNTAGGFVRAPVYGSDTGFVIASGSLTTGATNHNLVTSSLTGITTGTVATIKFTGTGAVDLTLSSGTTILTLAKTGMIRSGGGSTTISGGRQLGSRCHSRMRQPGRARQRAASMYSRPRSTSAVARTVRA